MTNKQRQCLSCSVNLGWRQRADALYCSSACRAIAYRRRTPLMMGMAIRKAGPTVEIAELMLRWNWVRLWHRALEQVDRDLIPEDLMPRAFVPQGSAEDVARELDRIAAALIALSRLDLGRDMRVQPNVQHWVRRRRSKGEWSAE